MPSGRSQESVRQPSSSSSSSSLPSSSSSSSSSSSGEADQRPSSTPPPPPSSSSPNASTTTMITAADLTSSTSAVDAQTTYKTPGDRPEEPLREKEQTHPAAMDSKNAVVDTQHALPLQDLAATHVENPPASPSTGGSSGSQPGAGPGPKTPVMTGTRFMALVGMAFLWTSAQIPAYFWGGIPPIVYSDIGGSDRWVWFITGNLLASAAVCPFVGALSDLLGRRYVALLGCALVVAGQLVCTFAHSMNTFIAGMTVSGIGAGINELTALAGTAEIAPTKQRGVYIAGLIVTILPFCPAVLWAQLIAAHRGWRFVGVLTAVYAFAGLLILAVFYHPPARASAQGLTSWRREILPRIDLVGGFLSIAGTVLLVAGLLWGGYQYAWASAHVLVPLLLGAALLAAFAVWEARFAAFPMVPRGLVGPHHPGAPGPPPRKRTMVLAMVITAVSGANFFSVLMLWPSQAYNMYGHDPVGVGLRGLPFALGVLIGCVGTLALLTRWRGGSRWLLFAASTVMTAGCGALAAARLHNLAAVYVILAIAGLGVGGIVVPASLVVTLVCPEALIATATALTLAVRVVGGAVGYSVYYNVLVHKLVPHLITNISTALVAGLQQIARTDPYSLPSGLNVPDLVKQIIALTAAAEIDKIADLPAVGGPDSDLYHALVLAGQEAYAAAYPYVYYVSIAFGVVSMAASLFMDDVGQYMDDHVAVTIV